MTDFSKMDFFKLKGAIQHYDWGGTRFIPSLLSRSNDENKPFAELWIGAHNRGSAYVETDEGQVGLDVLIAQNPEEFLGKNIAQAFGGQFPFLLKVLDAQKMLSIQVHPSMEQARAGFAAEEARKVPIDAPERNYKDRNHKPEVHMALTEFWMLHGFRPAEEIAELLLKNQAFQPLAEALSSHLEKSDFEKNDGSEFLRALYQHVMELPQEKVDAILRPMMSVLTPKYARNELEKKSPEFWAARAASDFPRKSGSFDRGVFSIYFLNLLRLRPGEGTFQPAGTLHAYLEGTNIELMSNSDNVLRGGLTRKHIDVPELLKTISFEGGKPRIITGTEVSMNEAIYETPIKDFQLSRIKLSFSCPFQINENRGPDALIVLDGKARVSVGEKSLNLRKGDVLFIKAGKPYAMHTDISATICRATAPLHTTS